MRLPASFRIVIVPHSHPKTKPKACNYGLALAQGEYVVIYDAEDKPEPDQLKIAYLAFGRVKNGRLSSGQAQLLQSQSQSSNPPLYHRIFALV
jgi:hypothetical protein